MTRRKKKLLPFQFTLAGFIAVVMASGLALGLLGYAATDLYYCNAPVRGIALLYLLGGAAILGGAIGAAIGHVFRDERGGMALMGAFFGTLLGPVVLVLVVLALVILFNPESGLFR